jgi:hypothetical protein
VSHIREDILRDLQNDLQWPLLVDEYFTDIGVIDYRKAELETEVQKTLSVISEKTGKCGVGVVVMPLRATDNYLNATNVHPLTIRASFLILEVPAINMGDAGTKKSALSVASRIRHLLKHYVLGGFASGLVPDGENFIVPVEDPIAPVAYEVNFTCMEVVDQNLFKCADLVPAYDTTAGTLQLSCTTPDATIYYTLDGGYPHPLNTGSTVATYSGPITIEGEVLVRAAAFKESHLPGNVFAARFNQIGDEDGELHQMS